MPNGSDRITTHPLQELQPTKTIDDPDIKAWLALGTKTKKKGGGKKKKGRLEEHVAIVLLFLVLHHASVLLHRTASFAHVKFQRYLYRMAQQIMLLGCLHR